MPDAQGIPHRDSVNPANNQKLETLRVPPQSVEAEQSVLGAIMLRPDVLPSLGLDEADFYRRDHRLIFRAMREVHDNGGALDPVTLGQWLDARQLAEQVGGTGYLVELASNTPSAANVSSYAAIVRDKATLRQMIETGTELVNAGFQPDGRTAAEIYTTAQQSLGALVPRIIDDTPPVTDLFGEVKPPTLSADFLPPPIAEYIFATARVKSIYPEAIFVSALTAIATAIHSGFSVSARPNEPSWTEPMIQWGMIVGGPGHKKTPAIKAAAGILHDMNAKMMRDNEQALAEYDRAMKVYNLADRKRQRAQANGDGSPEAEPAPERPKTSRILTTDFTVEAIAALLANNERGMLAYTDELVTWLGKMGKYSNGSGDDRAAWLQFYQGGPKTIDRASRSLHVPHAAVNVVGGIQPDKLRALFAKDADDGLLQRFIVAVLPNELLPDCEDPEPTGLREHYNGLLAHMWATKPVNRAVIPFSPDAVAVRREFDRWWRRIAEMDGLPPMLRSTAAKYEGLFPRLCGLYHAVACATMHRYPGDVAIQGRTAERVATLIRQWIYPSHMAFYTNVLGNASPSWALARVLAEWILTTDSPRLTPRDFAQNCVQWRSAAPWQQQGATAALEQAGWLLPTEARRGAQAWTINPRVAVEFRERAMRARVRRQTAAETLNAARADYRAGRGDVAGGEA